MTIIRKSENSTKNAAPAGTQSGDNTSNRNDDGANTTNTPMKDYTRKPDERKDARKLPDMGGKEWCKRFSALAVHIRGREFEIAQKILGLSEGDQPDDPTHRQACPICKVSGAFYCKYGRTFYCDHCGYLGSVFLLTSKIFKKLPGKNLDLIAEASGYDGTILTPESAEPVVVQEQDADDADDADIASVELKLDTAYNKPVNEPGYMLHSNIIPTAPTWQPFPLDTLPHQLRYFVEQVSQTIGIETANTAVCALSVLSGTIGRTFQIQLKQGYRELAMLWCAMIADSGFGKSPALDPVRAPLDQLQIKALEQYESDMKHYEEDLDRYKKRLPRLDKDEREHSGTKIVKRYEPLQTKPTEPIRQRYTISQSTTEALLPVLAANPYGVCLIRDELTGYFNGLDAYRSGKAALDRQMYIEFHGGRLVQSDRKTGTRYVAAKTPSVSIIGGVQSEIIRWIVQNMLEFLETGFGARFLWTYPPAKPIYWNLNVADPMALSSYDKLVGSLLSYRGRFTPTNPGIILLSPDAQGQIFRFQNRHADELLDTTDGSMRYAINKAGMHAARLCLNLHVVKCTEEGIDPCTPVSPATMEMAIVLTEWFLNESRRVYAMFRGQGTSDDKESAAILNVINEKGEVTKADLHCLQVFRKAGHAADVIDAKLSELRSRGIIESYFQRAPNGGRGKEVFRFPVQGIDSGTIQLPDENEGSAAKAG